MRADHRGEGGILALLAIGCLGLVLTFRESN
jgi:hypothetical protein